MGSRGRQGAHQDSGGAAVVRRQDPAAPSVGQSL